MLLYIANGFTSQSPSFFISSCYLDLNLIHLYNWIFVFSLSLFPWAISCGNKQINKKMDIQLLIKAMWGQAFCVPNWGFLTQRQPSLIDVSCLGVIPCSTTHHLNNLGADILNPLCFHFVINSKSTTITFTLQKWLSDKNVKQKKTHITSYIQCLEQISGT